MPRQSDPSVESCDEADSPPSGDTWVAIRARPLPVGGVGAWAVVPDCGAVVTFTGTVRDHALGRPGVSALEYEAYEEQATARMQAVVDAARARWPDIRRVAAIHRVGRLAVSDAAVVVAVSSPHRSAAFAAAQYCIDTLKSSVPIWKRESWDGGQAWGVDTAAIAEVGP